MAEPQNKGQERRKTHEAVAFLLLAVVLFPLLSVVLVGGFGFVIWMQHLLSGPAGM
jgi:nitrate reductase NapE